MKKIVYSAAVLLFTAVMFFAACPEENDKGGVTFKLAISGSGISDGKLTLSQDSTRNITLALTASDGSDTAGNQFSYTFICTGHTGCGVSLNSSRTMILIAANASEGDHALNINAVKAGEIAAKVDLIISVTLTPYSITAQPEQNLQHWDGETEQDTKYIYFTMKAPYGDTTGITYSITPCSTHTSCPLSFTKIDGDLFKINRVSETVALGAHALKINAVKDGSVAAFNDFTLMVYRKYVVNLPELVGLNMDRKRGEWIELSTAYTLVSSTDGNNINYGVNQTKSGIMVTAFCLADYADCDLCVVPCAACNSTGKVGGLDCTVCEGDGSAFTTMTLDFFVPQEAKLGKMHGMKMEVFDVKFGTDPDDWNDDEWGNPIASLSFTITVHSDICPMGAACSCKED